MKDLITLTAAAKELPGEHTPNTLWRWTQRGLQGRRSKRYIKLRHVRVGGRLYTKKEWLKQYLEDLAECDIEPAVIQHPNRNCSRTLSVEHAIADAELKREGI